MKKFLFGASIYLAGVVLAVLFFLFIGIAYSGDYAQQQTWVDEETITHTKLNLDIGGIIGELNDIENENIAATAAIAYGKLNLVGNVINADIGASAGIAGSKLAEITQDDKVDFTALNVASETQGDIMYFNGTAWVRLGTGTDGQLLKSQGADANPEWTDAFTLTTVFGTWTTQQDDVGEAGVADYTHDLVYLAATDGLVVVGGARNTGVAWTMWMLTDSSNPPTTVRHYMQSIINDGSAHHGMMCPVKKGHYWKLTGTSLTAGGGANGAIFWLPIGS